jgi:hypothetical protein
MSVEVVPGGQRRIDRVLDPGVTAPRVISSFRSKGSSPNGSGAGADAYLIKPFSSLALLEAVKRLTDG